MADTILGLFDDPIDARHAMDQLRDSGLKIDDISIISRATASGAAISADDVSAGTGAAVGAVWGGLVGLAALLIPGVGPFIALGALGAALTGAVTGAVVGGIAAALIDFGDIPEDQARAYETQIQAGKTLVAVKVDPAGATDARRILVGSGASSIYNNQTDLASGGGAHVRMRDDAGQPVSQALEYGAPANPTTIDRDPFANPAIDRSPNAADPVIEDAPTAQNPMSIGRAGPVTPDNAPPPELDARAPTPRSPAADLPPEATPDTNIPPADDREKPPV